MGTQNHAATHSVGTWEVHTADSTRKGFDIQTVGGNALVAYNIKNESVARLIAAAPDLLEALRYLVEFRDSMGTDFDHDDAESFFAQARAAIAKATQ